MEEAVAFFESYLDFEHRGSLAILDEPDEVLKALRSRILNQFWHEAIGTPISPTFGRPPGMTPDQMVTLSQKMRPVRRSLLLVAEHEAPKTIPGKPLYAGYISGDTESTAQSYGGLLVAAIMSDGEMKLVASYKEDFMQSAPPVRWRQSQGLRISLVCSPVAVRPLKAPTGRAVHQQDWQRLARRRQPK
ncbi:hypothetical protein ACFYXM_35075 [Streptomyces sp. NPDC002476]|uniref:hypothetical protein n=1 Tax=Streptomyces sp. NPDC002476 TaxID=3364648 RepID=UPI0036B97C91